jgi:hypothetical protein
MFSPTSSLWSKPCPQKLLNRLIDKRQSKSRLSLMTAPARASKEIAEIIRKLGVTNLQTAIPLLLDRARRARQGDKRAQALLDKFTDAAPILGLGCD